MSEKKNKAATEATIPTAQLAKEEPRKKTSCPITREQFNKTARAETVKFGDKDFIAAPKQFSTGSMGWNANEKITLIIDGIAVKCQVGLNVTIVGSKELPAK